jgi:hypothetical protein
MRGPRTLCLRISSGLVLRSLKIVYAWTKVANCYPRFLEAELHSQLAPLTAVLLDRSERER